MVRCAWFDNLRPNSDTAPEEAVAHICEADDDNYDYELTLENIELENKTGRDFLKPRIAPKRVPFPTCPQIGKGDAFVGVIDRSGKAG